MSSKKKVLFIVVTVIALGVLFLFLRFGRNAEKRVKDQVKEQVEDQVEEQVAEIEEGIVTIKVDGFEVAYNVTNTELSIEDFQEIELGCSLDEVIEKVGEPDLWIGCGMLWPIYFLEGKKAVSIHFEYPLAYENLWIIELFDENGEGQIIKINEEILGGN